MNIISWLFFNCPTFVDMGGYRPSFIQFMTMEDTNIIQTEDITVTLLILE